MTNETRETQPLDIEYLLKRFIKGVRHSTVLGMELVELTPPGLIVKLPYSEQIVGNPETEIGRAHV